MLVDILGYTIILPLLPFYAENLGASPTVVGLLVSAFAVCQFVAGPLLGRISDDVGRRPVLIVSQIGTLIGFLILANAHVLWVVFLSRIIDGLTAGNLSLAQAYIADVTKPSERSKNSFESSGRNSDETLAPKTRSFSIPMQTPRSRFPKRVFTK